MEGQQSRLQMQQDRCDYTEIFRNASQSEVHSDTGQIFQWGITIFIVNFMN